MERHILPGNPEIEVLLRPSARARRMSLRVSRLDGRVTLTLPQRTPKTEALAFLQDRAAWLRKHLSQVHPAERPAFGQLIPFEGRPVTLTPADVRRTTLDETRLLMPDDPDKLLPRLKAFYKTRARDALAAACARHSAALGKPHGKITLRDTRSRWGSCTSRGDLMFSWRLIMAPPTILDYVAAHEVAHLAHMDHSPAFWATCERLYPGTKPARAWLREDGTALHQIILD